MGAWGTGPFENDDAADWAYDLEDRGVEAIREAFAEVGDSGEDYVEGDVGAMAIAAAEVVARMMGRPGIGTIEEPVQTWIEANRDTADLDSLAADARRALESVLGENSELLEVWDESGNAAEWRTEIEDLQLRLAAV